MALGNFVGGRYSSTYQKPAGSPQGSDASPVALGLVEKGYTLSFSHAKDLITDTDGYGKMVVDALTQGIGNVFLGGVWKEWLAQQLVVASPYQAAAWPATGAGYFGPGLVGLLDTTVAGGVVLTATTGTAAATSPASATFTYAITAEGFEQQLMFGPEHRKLPFRFRIYPYVQTVVKFFTVT